MARMPRRNNLSSTSARASSNVSFRDTSLLPSTDTTYLANVTTLRRQWQWATFSQFFYTFAQLLQMPDVQLADVEDDLARGTSIYLPRIMHRLLVTMSQDRKLTIDNWQTAFRKQCFRRSLTYNPLGPEPQLPSERSTAEPDQDPEKAVGTPITPLPETEEAEKTEDTEGALSPLSVDGDNDNQQTKDDGKDDLEDPDGKHDSPAESKDWADLTMKQKLVALHMLTEWQFDNPHRLRQLMKDDGDSGHWRIEPIGYDAKTNAYWLIGPDRLWIQRALPKPPRPAKRKRPAPVKKVKIKPSTSKVAEESDSEPEPETAPTKRSRTSNARATRSRAKETDATPSGRSARAAKLRANKKLDAQAKEFAEFQRQAALLASPSKSSARATRSTRAQPSVPTSPPKRPVLGTRASARLRGPSKDEDEDEEWQQIPDEWLNEDKEQSPSPTGQRTRSKGKARADPEEQDHADELAQAGLGDDAVSELTELSDSPENDATEDGQNAPPTPEPEPIPRTRRKNGRKVKAKEEEEEFAEVHLEEPSEDIRSHIPKDFIEWETICVTLLEWEEISERFANATHYLEKALHKVLSQSIVPAIIAELKEAERKRKIEEAVVHRKRSSRIALKEVVKEEARISAVRRAEEEEKMARARRQEARAKKEEAEREKREQAREQRRLEREARERKIQSRNEPKEQEPEPEISPSPSPAPPTIRGPSINGIFIPTPLGLDNPNGKGARNADWVLDCEICHKSGVNVDDGMPMVSCGVCGRWQHIPCHDRADRNAGYSKRNWDVQQFMCHRCRTAQSARMPNGNDRHPNAHHQSIDQYAWSQPRTQKGVPQTLSAGYSQSSPDVRYAQQAPYDNRLAYGQPQPQYPHSSAQATASMYPRAEATRPLTFTHYQPEQRGFSQNFDSRWANGYQGITPSTQHFNEQSAYGSSRVAPSYQGSSSSSHQYNRVQEGQAYSRPYDSQPYNRVSSPQTHSPNGNWSHSPDTQHASSSVQRSASHLSAAESLAFMQGSTPSMHGWPNNSYGQQLPANGVHHPATAPHQHHQSMSNGHGSSYQFPTA